MDVVVRAVAYENRVARVLDAEGVQDGSERLGVRLRHLHVARIETNVDQFAYPGIFEQPLVEVLRPEGVGKEPDRQPSLAESPENAGRIRVVLDVGTDRS
jgi:hypothetical protein